MSKKKTEKPVFVKPSENKEYKDAVTGRMSVVPPKKEKEEK